MQIAAVGRALPPHRYPQGELTTAFAALVDARGGARHGGRIGHLHRAVGVGTRHLALAKEAYPELDGFGARNRVFVEVGTDVGAEALERALAAAGLSPADVDALFFVTVTGVAVPTIDARLVNRLGLRPDVKRLPLFGLGCVAGAAGVARLHDYLRAYPEQVAALVSVELCSLALQPGDHSAANLIATGLFGDGAAAVVGVGAARGAGAGPRVLASRSRLYLDTERVMGWDVESTGFKIVLDKSVPAVVERHLAADVDAFLADHGLARADVGAWVCHPGGPKVLEAMERSLELPPGALTATWRSLEAVGNLSSASVLFVLADHLAAPPPPGSVGVLLAMGPGFCSELVLLEW